MVMLDYLGRFALIAVAASFLGQTPAPATAKSPDPAVERVEKMLEDLEAREMAKNNEKRTYTLTEPDLNAYLAAKIAERPRKDVESLKVEMKEGFFTTHILVDFDQVEIKGDSMTKTLVKAILHGKQTIEVDGRLQTDNGKGTYQVERASLNGMPLPSALVNSILSSVGRRQDPPFDPIEPFDLPYALKTVKVTPGKAVLET
ncbi:MAG: hypothetical protein EHM61_07165 [Acidobacteria bacterium]|nr:MAG: hypothetical protein EHM61_07165 [Acidobacteriota bacterium]